MTVEETTIESRTHKIIVEQLGLNRPPLGTDRLAADLGCDSLDLVELAMAIEDEFCIQIDDEEGVKCLTVADAVALVTASQPS
jgi:acyl carrier protein